MPDCQVSSSNPLLTRRRVGPLSLNNSPLDALVHDVADCVDHLPVAVPLRAGARPSSPAGWGSKAPDDLPFASVMSEP